MTSNSNSEHNSLNAIKLGAARVERATKDTLMGICKANQELQQKEAKVYNEMFDRRNQANYEWQQLDNQGRVAREQVILKTHAELKGIEDTAQEVYKRQEIEQECCRLERNKRKDESEAETRAKQDEIIVKNSAKMSEIQTRKVRGRLADLKSVKSFEKEGKKVMDRSSKEGMAERDQIQFEGWTELEQIKAHLAQKLEQERMKQEEAQKSGFWNFFSKKGPGPDPGPNFKRDCDDEYD